MSRTYTNRTRGAQTTRPTQKMNPTKGMSEELPAEPQRDASPARREPRHAGSYTVFPPDEKKRQAIQRQADEEARKYEAHKAATRPHYSYVGTVGGGESTSECSSGAGATAVPQRKLQASSTLSTAQKIKKYKQEEKLRKEAEYDKVKQAARQKTIENERREREREERFKSDEKRARNALLDKLQGKSSGNVAERSAGVSSLSSSGPSASASVGGREGDELPVSVGGLRQLEAMFPTVEKDVLRALLHDADNNVDSVIEFLSQ